MSPTHSEKAADEENEEITVFENDTNGQGTGSQDIVYNFKTWF